MAKNSFEKSPSGRSAKTKPEGITPSWTHFEPVQNDPHDSWDKDAFEKTIQNDPHDSWDENAFKDTLKGDKTAKAETELKKSVALNKPVEKVKEGDVSSIKSKKVVYGAAREGLVKSQEEAVEKMKGTRVGANTTNVSDIDIAKFQTSGTAKGGLVGEVGSWTAAPEPNIAPTEVAPTPEPTKDEIAKELALKRQAERGASPENLKEFGEAYVKWKEARDHSDKLEKQFNAEYEKFLGNESVGWRKFVNIPRRLLGLRPKMTGNILSLFEQSEQARSQYFESAKKLKDIKKGDTYGANHKVVERYQRLLAHKLVVGVHEKRAALQEKIAVEAGKNSRIRPVLETMRKYRYVRWGATALGYAALAGATGGVGAAVFAGGAYGARVASGAVMGGLAGSLTRFVGGRFEKAALKDLEEGQDSVKKDFFSRSFNESEKEIGFLVRDLEQTKALKKTSSAAVAMAAGFQGGLMWDDIHTPGNGGSGIPLEKSPVPNGGSEPLLNNETPISPSVLANTVPKPMGDLSVMEEMRDLADKKVPVPLKEMGDLSVMEEMQEVANKKGDMQLTGIPDPKMEGVPPDLEAKGGLKVTEIPDPKMEGVPPDLEAGAESPLITHTVVSGENAWNIMEGRGPDANPVGGKSVFLQEMNLPVGERQMLLDKAIDYLEKNPELAKEIGAIKSGGDIHKIYPGEVLNITKFDELLRNIHDGVDPGAVPETPVADLDSEEYLGTEDEPHEPEDIKTDINEFTLDEVIELGAEVAKNDPAAVERLEELGMDVPTFMDMFGSLSDRGTTENLDTNMTVREFLNNSEKVFDNSDTSGDTKIPDATPYGLGKPIPPSDEIVRDANVPAAEVPAQSLSNYVRSIEQPRNGIVDTLFGMGKPNVAGTFEQMKDLSMGELREMVANDSLPATVSDAGFDRWWGEVSNVPANDNERFGDVVARVANSRAA